jgi:hypothetical protein
MNLRHAAALVLVGWYLMVPPLSPSGPHYVVLRGAPLSEWIIDESFDSAAECEQARHDGILSARQSAEKAGICKPVPGSTCDDPLLQEAVLAKCIATDDPRLKETK